MAYNSGYWEEQERSLREELAEARAEVAKLQQQLREAQTEVERLAKSADWDIINALAEVDLAEAALEDAKAEIAEARAEINIIEHDANVLIGDIKAELECKNKLIEQMKTAMEAALRNLKMQGGSRTVIEGIKAALSAAERIKL